MTIADIGWGVVIAISLALHGMWPLAVFWPVGKFLKIERFRYHIILVLVIFVGWIAVVTVSAGCPLTYLHETILLEAGWIDKRNYRFEDSVAYKYVIKPVRNTLTTGDATPTL